MLSFSRPSADIADVAGWHAPVGSVTGTRFNAVIPGRILDTRSGVNNGS